AADMGCRLLAREMLTNALPHAGGLGLRGTAQAVLGLVDLLAADPGATAERRLLDARESLEFLEDVCFDQDQLALVGNTGWHSRGGDKASADEQAIDATALV